jgi:hypothetical protein
MGGIVVEDMSVLGNHLVDALSDTAFVSGRLTSSIDTGLITAIRHSDLFESVIRDKSKADTLIKLLWMRQTIRLLLEVVTRAAIGLAITQFEIIRLSYSVISLFIFFLQWSKPKDVEKPIVFIPERISSYGLSIKMFERLSCTYLDSSPASPLQVTDDVFHPDHDDLLLAALTIPTNMFGVIHSTAWSFKFPTLIETLMWRSCALLSIVLPLILFVESLISNLRHAYDDRNETRREEVIRQIEDKAGPLPRLYDFYNQESTIDSVKRHLELLDLLGSCAALVEELERIETVVQWRHT